jgi:hypothetical protein
MTILWESSGEALGELAAHIAADGTATNDRDALTVDLLPSTCLSPYRTSGGRENLAVSPWCLLIK